MRLGFYYHVPAVQNGDGIYTPGFQGRFIDSLADHIEEVVCFLHSPRQSECDMMDHRIVSDNVELIDIGPHASVPRRLLSSGRVKRLIGNKSSKLDVMLIRGPSVLLPAIARGSRAPIALLLVNDYLAGLKSLEQTWWREWLIRAWAEVNFQQQMRISQHSLTIVNSRLLYEQLLGKVPHLIETRTTTLTRDDFFERDDTCHHTPYRLLFTGRIAREKGVLDMVEALAMVIKTGEDVTLDLVGMVDDEEILRIIERRSAQLGISERVKYHGYRPVGPELFSFYKGADIYILASRSAFEGFPRTIWEAMAHSLPVIATRIGSIPDIVRNTAELVEPGNTKELAQAISGIIGSSEKRKRLIISGFALAKENTLEKHVGQMVIDIQDWLNNR